MSPTKTPRHDPSEAIRPGACRLESSGTAPEDGHRPAPRRLVRLAGRLTAVNGLVLLAGLLTGPLLAHALGPEGRGTLAAILVPLGVAPFILSLGLESYAARQAARGEPLGPLFGSVGALTLLVGAAGMAAVVPLVIFLAHGRHVVLVFLLVGFALMPFGLIQSILFGIAMGRQRWRAVSLSRLTPGLLGLAALAVLFALDQLTVTTASIVTLAASVLASVPLLPVAVAVGRPRFSGAIAREGLAFGLKDWLAQVGAMTNVRLDQLIMIRLVSPAQLGLYAVAATLAGFSLVLTSAVSGATLSVVAQGEAGVAARSVRLTVLVIVALSVPLALVTPFALPLLFSHDFAGAVPMALVLLVAGVPLAGVSVLGRAMTTGGHPGAAAIAQGVAVGLTLPGLFLLVPVLGALGAAAVSLVAYAASFAVSLALAPSRLGGSIRDYLVPTDDDIDWLWSKCRESARKIARTARDARARGQRP